MELSERQRNRLIEFLASKTDRWLSIKQQYPRALRGASRDPAEAHRPIHAGIWLGDPVQAVFCMTEEVDSWDLPDPTARVLACRLRDVLQLMSNGDLDGAARRLDGLVDLVRGYGLGLSQEQELYLTTWARYISLLISDRSV